MREDWDRRAQQDAESFIYTRDQQHDAEDFARSGEANYNQLVRPYLPILLPNRTSHDAHVVEIGCGIGRMTEWFARAFAHVDAIDVSPVMIDRARRRLAQFRNIAFHTGNGSDLVAIADASADFVFSYIVFQHIPSREAIERYVREAGRVLKSGGAFKFQLNGDQNPAALTHPRDTWLGEVFSQVEAEAMLADAGFSLLSQEGAGTQYYVLTAVRGDAPEERPYVLPGEPWADSLLLEGFGPAVDASWRPIAGRARVHVPGRGTRIYAGIYFWPESCHHTLTIDGNPFGVTTPGDHYFECPSTAAEVLLTLDPQPSKRPAFRIIGRC
jgi:SAM-dependent methyltransferase